MTERIDFNLKNFAWSFIIAHSLIFLSVSAKQRVYKRFYSIHTCLIFVSNMYILVLNLPSVHLCQLKLITSYEVNSFILECLKTQPIPWIRVLLEKLIVCTSSQGIPAFDGTIDFITVFTWVWHIDNFLIFPQLLYSAAKISWNRS